MLQNKIDIDNITLRHCTSFGIIGVLFFFVMQHFVFHHVYWMDKFIVKGIHFVFGCLHIFLLLIAANVKKENVMSLSLISMVILSVSTWNHAIHFSTSFYRTTTEMNQNFAFAFQDWCMSLSIVYLNKHKFGHNGIIMDILYFYWCGLHFQQTIEYLLLNTINKTCILDLIYIFFPQNRIDPLPIIIEVILEIGFQSDVIIQNALLSLLLCKIYKAFKQETYRVNTSAKIKLL